MITDELKAVEEMLCKLSSCFNDVAEANTMAMELLDELEPYVEGLREIATETQNKSPHGLLTLNCIATVDEVLKLPKCDHEQDENNVKYVDLALDKYGQFISSIIDEHDSDDLEPLM